MKKFILGGLIGMLGALMCVVIVWWYLQRSLYAPAVDELSSPSVTSSTTAEIVTSTTTAPTQAATPTTSGVPVRDLPLTTEQRQVAEALGFDVEQMVLSPALITCARETLGESRYQAVLAGDTPTMLETARLLPCVGR